jgi:Holliday junction resolvase
VRKAKVQKIYIGRDDYATIEFAQKRGFATEQEIDYKFTKAEVRTLRPLIRSLEQAMIRIAKEGLSELEINLGVSVDDPEADALEARRQKIMGKR